MSFSSFLFRITTLVALIVLSLSTWTPFSEPVSTAESAADFYPKTIKLQENSKIPLSFIPNVGQMTPPWQFQAQGISEKFFFSSDHILMLSGTSTFPFALHFLGASPDVEITSENRMPGIINYFVGNDPSRWYTNLPTYTNIIYRQLYPGIDLRYDGEQGFLKGTFTLATGSNPDDIHWCYGGQTSVSINETTGDLLVKQRHSDSTITSSVEIELLRESAPLAWQEINGRWILIPIKYVLLGDHNCLSSRKIAIGFDVGQYDRSYPLFIDPVLEFSTYLGGTHDDIGLSIAVDSVGNTYVTGTTQSNDFPVAMAWQPDYGGGTCAYFPCSDAFITKLSADGSTVLYSTYLGGSGSDEGWDLSVSSNGDVYVTGDTSSVDFPTVEPFQSVLAGERDAFFAKLDVCGRLVYSTYLGGTETDVGTGILYSAGNIYIAGATYSSNFPTENPFQSGLAGWSDAFVVNFNVDSTTMLYSTYLGGSDQDFAYHLTVDGDNSVYVTGPTRSNDFPTEEPFQAARSGEQDVFVTKLSQDGATLIYSTYLGGSEWDEGHSIAVDTNGNAYIVGNTMSADFPLTQPFQSSRKGYSDAFISRIKADGSGLDYSTYLGGEEDEIGWDIKVDDKENVYVVGKTFSLDFPVAHPLQGFNSDGCLSGSCSDAFAVKLKADGQSLLFSTFFGGSDSEDARGIAVDSEGDIYITGRTWSIDFPVINAFQPEWNEGYGCVHNFCPDGFVSKIALTPSTSGVDTYVQAPAWVGGEPGMAAMLPIQYGNNGASDALSVTITATMNVSLTYLSDSSGITPTVIGNSLVWSLPDLVFLETHTFSLVTKLPADAVYGDLYEITIVIGSAVPDAFPDDNIANSAVMAARRIFLPWITK